MQKMAPDELCAKDQYFVENFKVTPAECKAEIAKLVGECLRELDGQMPDRFDEAKGEHWGKQVGICAGGRYDKTMEDKFQPTTKLWSKHIQEYLPEEFCKTGQYFMECYEVSIAGCKTEVATLTAQCLKVSEGDLPTHFDSAEKNATWGRTIGTCAGERYDTIMAAKFQSSDKCNDPSAWGG